MLNEELVAARYPDLGRYPRTLYVSKIGAVAIADPTGHHSGSMCIPRGWRQFASHVQLDQTDQIAGRLGKRRGAHGPIQQSENEYSRGLMWLCLQPELIDATAILRG